MHGNVNAFNDLEYYKMLYKITNMKHHYPTRNISVMRDEQTGLKAASNYYCFNCTIRRNITNVIRIFRSAFRLHFSLIVSLLHYPFYTNIHLP